MVEFSYRTEQAIQRANREIRVSVRNVYGVETLYPACQTAAFFCALAGTKTLTSDMVRLIRANGYAIEAEAPKLAFRTAGGAHRPR